jgi:GT2 family glycosyltransferase
MSAAVSISVVICSSSCERTGLLQAALNSLTRQTTPPLEILVVVDNNDALLGLVPAMQPGIRVFSNDRGRGLSGARNVGVAQARGQVVAFIDDDATAAPDWIERLSARYQDPHAIAVGGRVVPVWPKSPPSWLPEEFYWVVGCSYRGLPEGVAPVRNLIGCNMSFRKAVFEKVAPFAEDLGREGTNAAGCEETELCIRVAEAFPDSMILHDPEAMVHHHVAAERLSGGYFRKRCLAEGRSKALMVGKTGTRSGLSSEREYSLRVLPAGIGRGIRDALAGRDAAGLARAGAIVAGLAYVSWSYLSSRLGLARPRATPSFAPIRIADVDLTKPLPAIQAVDPDTGERYASVYCLVRRAGLPIGVIEFPFHGDSISAAALQKLLPATEPSPPLRPAAVPISPIPVRVVVATRDRPAALAVCLDSLLRQDYRHFEIVVVDNAPSSAATAELVGGRYTQSGLVRYLREDRPGLGHAHNRGIADAIAPIIAFTDDDVIVDPQWLATIAQNFAEASTVGCVTGLILPAELDTRAQYWTERHGGFGKGFSRRTFDLAANRPKDRLFPFAAGAFGSGANMAFRTSALARIGGFDPALGAGTLAKGGDDLAAFASVVRAGYSLVYEPAAIVWHHHRRSEEGMRRQAYGYGVGLGAYLTKMVIDDPATMLDFAKAFPWALAHILSPSSGKNSRLPADYPAGLKWRERLGMLAGIPAYLRSRASMQRHLKAAAAMGPALLEAPRQASGR